MSNIREIPKSPKEIEEVLDQVRAQAGNLDCIIVVALDSDGQQKLWTSNTSGYKKAFMIQFLLAWMASWFNITQSEVPPCPPG